jgi:alpha-glucosidase
MPKGVGVIPDYIPANWEGQGNTHLGGAHNVYGTQMARATRMGMEKARPDKRPFVLTRAAYAGAQRYTVSWTGDNRSEWDHLKLSISMVLNLSLSGMFFTGPDIGGFMGDSEPELYARWIQLSSLLPFCRTHTATGTIDQEPWSFGPEVEKIARKYIELRYQLLPYLYSTYVQGALNGVPMVRPTFWEDPSDVRLYNQDDVYLVGDALLVAPIVEKGATKREFYLPRGVWYNFWTRKLIDGARTIEVEAPLDEMPIFVRAGRVLPMWPVMQYVGERPVEELQLLAFAGIGETTLYEDAGEGLGYRNGEYRYSYFSNKFLPGGQYAVEWRRAGKYEPPYKRVRLEIIGIPGEPDMLFVDDQPAALWFFENGMVEVLGNPFSQVRMVGKSADSSEAAKTVARKPGPSSS